jgi:hypothetical protein
VAIDNYCITEVTESANVKIVDMTGRIVSSKKRYVNSYNNEITMGRQPEKKGLCLMWEPRKRAIQNKFIVD